eukprot:65808-Rhodomonas_salina.6
MAPLPPPLLHTLSSSSESVFLSLSIQAGRALACKLSGPEPTTRLVSTGHRIARAQPDNAPPATSAPTNAYSTQHAHRLLEARTVVGGTGPAVASLPPPPQTRLISAPDSTFTHPNGKINGIHKAKPTAYIRLPGTKLVAVDWRGGRDSDLSIVSARLAHGPARSVSPPMKTDNALSASTAGDSA